MPANAVIELAKGTEICITEHANPLALLPTPLINYKLLLLWNHQVAETSVVSAAPTAPCVVLHQSTCSHSMDGELACHCQQ